MSEQTSQAMQLDLERLKVQVPLSGLMDAHLQALLQESEVLYRFAGDLLFEKGQFDKFDYFLLSGEVQLVDDRGGVTLLKGRESLLPIASAQPRILTAQIAADTKVLRVERQRLDQLLDWSQSAEYLLVDLAGQRSHDEDAAWLETVLKSNLFLKVPPTNVGGILACLSPKTVGAGDVILRQGELGDCCYFIKEGEAEVTRESGSSYSVLAQIGPGRCFGEDALIQQTVRNATVSMKTDGVLLTLQKQDFLPLLKAEAAKVINWPEINHGSSGDNEGAPTLLDVRTGDEYGQGHLEMAVNMPLHLLYVKHRLLDKTKRYVTYCNTGARSSSASYFLGQMGYDVVVLEAGLEGISSSTSAPPLIAVDYMLRDGEVVRSQ